MNLDKKKDRSPNIILILADDMGYSDIGCFGSEINIPNIDKLAESGVRFTHMYNCARCCPSRASLLTGLYPHQTGIGYMEEDQGYPAYKGVLNSNCVTIAEILNLSGYKTVLSGKWHVGGLSHPKDKNQKPKNDYGIVKKRGFDRYFGTLRGAGNYFNPTTLVLEDKVTKVEDEDYYHTDAITDYAIKTIEDFSKDKSPFFAYVAYTSPHWPLHAKEKDIAKYQGKYRCGWDRIRENRYEELKKLKFINSLWDLSERDKVVPPWQEAKDKDWEDRRMAVHAAMVDSMDQGIGRIMQKVKDLGIQDNTVIFFMSDNGGSAETPGKEAFSLFGDKTKEGRPIRYGNDPAIMPGPEDTFQSYETNWANVSNAPFKLYKSWVHEGGISTPFIVSWPDKIKSSFIVNSTTHFIDLMATILEIIGVPYPREYKRNKIKPIEGESFFPALLGKSWTRERPLYWEHMGNQAIRDGCWKLVKRFPGKWELYDMIGDRTETKDLSEKYKSDVKRLKMMYKDWTGRCGVRKWPI